MGRGRLPEHYDPNAGVGGDWGTENPEGNVPDANPADAGGEYLDRRRRRRPVLAVIGVAVATNPPMLAATGGGTEDVQGGGDWGGGSDEPAESGGDCRGEVVVVTIKGETIGAEATIAAKSKGEAGNPRSRASAREVELASLPSDVRKTLRLDASKLRKRPPRSASTETGVFYLNRRKTHHSVGFDQSRRLGEAMYDGHGIFGPARVAVLGQRSGVRSRPCTRQQRHGEPRNSTTSARSIRPERITDARLRCHTVVSEIVVIISGLLVAARGILSMKG